MAITKHLARLIVNRHQVAPIRGRVLLLGRQTVFLTPEQALLFLKEMKVPVRTGAHIEIDKNTSVGRDRGFISDRSFFGLFTDAEILAIDYSTYENADLIANLCEPLPTQVPRCFDFIYNGSVLDNVFDPASAMCNISELAAPGGTIFHYEGVAHWGSAYIKFMPDWFFDYYAINNFESCHSILCHYADIYESPWTVSEWWPFEHAGDSFKLTSVPAVPVGHDCLVVVIAVKSLQSTSRKLPSQGPYRRDHSEYIQAYQRFRSRASAYDLSKLNHGETVFVQNETKTPGSTKKRGWVRKLRRKFKNFKKKLTGAEAANP